MNEVFSLDIQMRKEMATERELPLSILKGKYKVVDDHTFTDEFGVVGVCRRHKFYNIRQIENMLENLENAGRVYIYKLWEYDEYGYDYEPTGNRHYNMRYCVRA
jgi:hypothetical protein